MDILDNTAELLLEKARKYDKAREKHNQRCYKYYFENHDEMKAKRRDYAKKYYQQKKDKLKTVEKIETQ